jgi:hypothetical protein
MGLIARKLSGAPRLTLLALLVLPMAAVAQVLLLRDLQYSKAALASVSLQEALQPADPLVLDGLRWHPEPYSRAPGLAPMRAMAREHCPGLSGFALGTCVSNVFAQRFSNGQPSREFFDRQHDPVAVFLGHMAGEPGHCVTRSGMLAATLLAAGTPARVAQILGGSDGFGHNVIEIWDQARGWRVMDPSFAGLPVSPDGKTSAVDLTLPPFPHWQREPALRMVEGVDQQQALLAYGEEHLRGARVVYPDPWLYTRVGSDSARFPFLGRFVLVGPRALSLGIGQPLLQAGIVLSVAAWLAVAARLLWRIRSRQRVAVAIDAPLLSGQSTS